MLNRYSTRRHFLNYGKLPLLFLLNACTNNSKKISVSLQSSFYPQSLKDTLPASWQQENIDFSKLKLEKYKKKIFHSDFVLINDGWINSIDFESFQNINNLFEDDILNKISRDFLKSFNIYKSSKLFPIGVVPYAAIIKNNKDLIADATNSWDFLLNENLKGKIIFPQSPRIIMSISKKISTKNSLNKLKDQVMVFDDQNAMNWLINSQTAVAIVPYFLVKRYLKIDSRLYAVFPNQGVPLIWYFILNKSKINNQILINWIKSFDKRSTIDELANQGWYLPFNNAYSQHKYIKNSKTDTFGPSKICWENSWSLSPVNNKDQFNLENLWNLSLTP